MSNVQLTERISLFAVEISLTIILITVSLTAPRLGSKWFRRLEIGLGRLAKRRGLSVLVVGLSAMLVRALTAPFTPIRAKDRKSTRLNSSHRCISYAVFC